MTTRGRPPWAGALLLAGHPAAAAATSAGVALAAVLFGGRTGKEIVLVAATVLVGQLTVGWVDDIADRDRDRLAGREDRPIAMGWLSTSTAAWSTAYATCVLVPLAMSNGTEAGAAYLLAVVVAWAGRWVLRSSALSFLPPAASFALLPAFLSYGGWGGGHRGDPPTLEVTVAAALLGVGVHFATALPDLAGDHITGLRHLPLRVARRIGAKWLLWLTTAYVVLAAAAVVLAGATAGLRP